MLGAGHSFEGRGDRNLSFGKPNGTVPQRRQLSDGTHVKIYRWALLVHPSCLSVEVTNFCLPLSWALCVALCFEKPKYAGVRMAISKVHKAQTFLGVIPQSATPLIQIVLIDDEAGTQTGTAAEQLAADIMEDIAQHGNTAALFGRSPVGAPKATTVQSFLSPTSSPCGSPTSLLFHQGITQELSDSLVEAP